MDIFCNEHLVGFCTMHFNCTVVDFTNIEIPSILIDQTKYKRSVSNHNNNKFIDMKGSINHSSPNTVNSAQQNLNISDHNLKVKIHAKIKRKTSDGHFSNCSYGESSTRRKYSSEITFKEKVNEINLVTIKARKLANVWSFLYNPYAVHVFESDIDTKYFPLPICEELAQNN